MASKNLTESELCVCVCVSLICLHELPVAVGSHRCACGVYVWSCLTECERERCRWSVDETIPPSVCMLSH